MAMRNLAAWLLIGAFFMIVVGIVALILSLFDLGMSFWDGTWINKWEYQLLIVSILLALLFNKLSEMIVKKYKLWEEER